MAQPTFEFHPGTGSHWQKRIRNSLRQACNNFKKEKINWLKKSKPCKGTKTGEFLHILERERGGDILVEGGFPKLARESNNFQIFKQIIFKTFSFLKKKRCKWCICFQNGFNKFGKYVCKDF